MTATTAAVLSHWFDEGVAQSATHMIVVVDEFNHDDYPVYVPADRDAVEVFDSYSNKSMQRVMEVYDLAMDKQSQMSEGRAFHLPRRSR